MELIYYVYIIALILALVIIFFAVSYMRQYYHQLNLKNEIKIYQDKYFDAWFDYLFKDNTNPPPFHTQSEQKASKQIFFALVRNGSTPCAEERISLFISKNHKDTYQGELTSNNWARRVNALSEITDFKVDGFTYIYSEQDITKFSREERVLYFIYLSLFNQSRFESLFFSRLDLNEYECKLIFNRLPHDYLLELRGSFHLMIDATQCAYMDILSTVRDAQVVEWLETQLSNENLELRIRALKNIHSIGYIIDAKKYEPFFISDHWQERMFAIRIAPLYGSEFEAHVASRLDDEHRLVKSEAHMQLSRITAMTEKYYSATEARI